MKKLILVAALWGCMTVQGFAQVNKIVFVHETFTISSTEDATSGAEYRWRKDGKILSEPGAASYNGSVPEAGTYTFIREARKDALCDWMPSNPFVVAAVPGTNQLQGSCTFTQPPVVNTFANFPADYSASTFVTLTDERDGNNYTVVKMPDGKWWMAQNLNYQKGLTWQANASEPSTVSGQNTDLIGHFWCPGGYGGTDISTSTLASCDVWGALYSWETAMMVDGKWSDDNRNSTAWADVSYSTNNSSGNTNNGGKGVGSHGICPANWHVPTDAEWGDILNEMETGTKDHNTNTSWIGTNAGSRGKSSCTCGSGVTGSSCVDDVKDNWHYHSSNAGNDYYGFRVLPTGSRYYNGSYFDVRGLYAYFWSSSASNQMNAWYRSFASFYVTVSRSNYTRSHGFSVRCVRD
jgi:uncharacterized protein (TIGR02145 family)